MPLYFRTRVGPFVYAKRVQPAPQVKPQSPRADLWTAIVLVSLLMFMVLCYFLGR